MAARPRPSRASVRPCPTAEWQDFVSDEPTDLPEGTEAEIVVEDAFADMDPQEHAEFLKELDASCDEADAGELIDAADVLAKLRTQG